MPAAILLLFALCKVGSTDLATSAALTNQPIVVVSDPEATHNLRPRPDRVQVMVGRAITELTSEPIAEQAWKTLVNSNDVVAIKVFSSPGPNTGTRVAVVDAVAQGLLSAGVRASNIIIWDRSAADLKRAGFGTIAKSLGVRLEGALETGFNETDSYEFALVTGLRYGDLEFGTTGEGVGRRSFVTKLLGPNVTKIISIAPASNKRSTGVTGHLYSMTLGSVDNSWRFESNPSTLSWALPEIYAKRSIGDRVVLCITDALICQYEGEDTTLLHYSAVANELYFSTDPIALDLLALRLLETERRSSSSSEVKPDLNMYRNAALLQLGVDDLDLVPIKRIPLKSESETPKQMGNTKSPMAQP